ncbi:MAG: hypothetical protein JST02_04995 [Bacteroidetes bacterium]|nr:hypothetical protein [Bacteroidota bacterium]
MKLFQVILVAFVCCLSCNENNADNTANNSGEPVEQEKQSFFPVTDFIKGQLQDIRKDGINPLKFTTANGKTDSAWLKIEDFEKEIGPFLSPVIDSTNLTSLFTEKRFLDQTINAFTFTYDPVKQIPDSFAFQRWDVYVDPQKNTVNRIFLIKKLAAGKKQLLTWVPGVNCKIVTVYDDGKGKSGIEKDVTIKWDF